MKDYDTRAPDEAQHFADGGKTTGHFSRYRHLRQSDFASAEEVAAHIDALRSEW